jgi:hypothetical protein
MILSLAFLGKTGQYMRFLSSIPHKNVPLGGIIRRFVNGEVENS